MVVSIYIKYKSHGNPKGKGAAGAVLEYIDSKGKVHLRQQGTAVEHETKNALALEACICAMRALTKPCRVTVHIDCSYLSNTYSLGRLGQWQAAGWKKANGSAPANADKWKQFWMLAGIHSIQFEPYNGRYEQELKNTMRGQEQKWKKELD